MDSTFMLEALGFSVSAIVSPRQKSKRCISTCLLLFQTVPMGVYRDNVRTKKDNVPYLLFSLNLFHGSILSPIVGIKRV